MSASVFLRRADSGHCLQKGGSTLHYQSPQLELLHVADDLITASGLAAEEKGLGNSDALSELLP